MAWEKLNKNTWQKITSKYDLIVSKFKEEYYLDIFNTKVKNNSKAYIETFAFRTLGDAKKDADLYI